MTHWQKRGVQRGNTHKKPARSELVVGESIQLPGVMYNARKHAKMTGDPRRIHKTQERPTRTRLATRSWSPLKITGEKLRPAFCPVECAVEHITASGNCQAASGGGQVCAGIHAHAAFQDTYPEAVWSNRQPGVRPGFQCRPARGEKAAHQMEARCSTHQGQKRFASDGTGSTKAETCSQCRKECWS